MQYDYSFLLSQPFSLIMYILLGLSILFVWMRKVFFLWMVTFVLSLMVGIYSGRIYLLGLFWVLYLWGSVYYLSKTKKGIINLLLLCNVFAICLLLKLHLLPGFNNWLVVDSVKLSTDSLPLNMYFNFDTTIIGILLLAYIVTKRNTVISIGKMLYRTKWFFLLTAVLLLSLSYIFGFINFAPKYSNLFFLWAIVNILSACISEELMFRGLFITQFSKYMNKYFALLVATLIFGLIHYVLGWQFVVVAMAAGLCYGWVYIYTKSIEVSIILHFLVNALHFVLFSYPILAK